MDENENKTTKYEFEEKPTNLQLCLPGADFLGRERPQSSQNQPSDTHNPNENVLRQESSKQPFIATEAGHPKDSTEEELTHGWGLPFERSPNFSVIVLGWLTPEIIKRSLASINRLENVNPKIYFAEQRSKNSDKIKELILSTPNVEGYIQMKENWAAASWKIIMEHFLQHIDDEFVAITDGDYIWDYNAAEKIIKTLNFYSDIGIIAQKRALLGVSRYWKSMILQGTDQGTMNDERNTKEPWGGKGITRCTINGMNLTTARKTDWQTFINCINEKNPSFGTHRIGEPWIPEYRPPLFWDVDLYKFFETVMHRSSFVLEEEPSYHITDEYENNSESEYSKEKGSYGYHAHWRDYQDDPDFFHNKLYPSGELKYEIII